jgi:hypothetical protein
MKTLFTRIISFFALLFGISAGLPAASRLSFDSVFLWVTLGSPTLVPNDVPTPIQFTNSSFPVSETMNWGISDPDAIKIVPNENILYLLSGNVAFDPSPVGRRALHINFYDSADVQISGNTVFSLDAAALDATIVSFSFPFRFYGGVDHIKLTVYQDSGDVLNVVARITLQRIH